MAQPDILLSLGIAGRQAAEAALGSVEKAVNSLLKKAAGLLALREIGKQLVDSFNIAARFEQSEIALTSFLGSATEATKLLKQAQDFAAKTPFRFEEIENAIRLNIAYGESQETVIETTRMLGDISAGVAQPLGEIAYLYGTLRTQGTAMTKDIWQFTNRGIPILDALATQFNVTTAEVLKMVSAGKVGFPEVEKAFQAMTGEGGKFFQLTEKQSQSAAGKLSTLKDTIDLVKLKIGEDLLPIAKKAFGDLTISIQRVFLGMKDVEGGVASLDAAFMALKTTGQAVISVFVGLGKAWDWFVNAGQDAMELITGQESGFRANQRDLAENARMIAKNTESYRRWAAALGVTGKEFEKFQDSKFGIKALPASIGDADKAMLRMAINIEKWKAATKLAAEETKKGGKELEGIAEDAKFAAGSIGYYEDRISALNEALQAVSDSASFDKITAKIKTLELAISTIKGGTAAEELRQFLETAEKITAVPVDILPSTESIRQTYSEWLKNQDAVKDSMSALELASINLKESLKEIGRTALTDLAGGLGNALGQAIVGTMKLGEAMQRLAVDLLASTLKYASLALARFAFETGFPAGIPFLIGSLALAGASGLVSGLGSGIGRNNSPERSTAGQATPAAPVNQSGLSGFGDSGFVPSNDAYTILVNIDGQDLAASVVRVTRDVERRRGRVR